MHPTVNFRPKTSVLSEVDFLVHETLSLVFDVSDAVLFSWLCYSHQMLTFRPLSLGVLGGIHQIKVSRASLKTFAMLRDNKAPGVFSVGCKDLFNIFLLER